MYVFCVGMYRACSTWQYDVVAEILDRHRGGVRLGYMTGEEFAEYDEAQGRPRDGWRVLKSHEEHPRFREAIDEGRAVAIYAHRDVRDVAYSLMHKRGLSFDELLVGGMIHQVLANDRFWTARPGLLVQRYDDLVADPTTGIVELARHLGVTLDDGEADALASEYSLESNRRRAEALGRRLRERGVDLDDPTNAQLGDTETLLHWNHLRDGRVGGWRERATTRERAILERTCGAWLRSRGYDPDASRPVAIGPGTIASEASDRWLQVRGWLTCRLRCASLRYPRTAEAVKSLLGIAPAPRPHAASAPAGPRPSRPSGAPDRARPYSARPSQRTGAV